MSKVDLDGFIGEKKAQLDALKETGIIKRYLTLEAYIVELEKLKETILAEGDKIPEVRERKERIPRHRAKMPDVGNGRARVVVTSTAAEFDPTLETNSEVVQ